MALKVPFKGKKHTIIVFIKKNVHWSSVFCLTWTLNGHLMQPLSHILDLVVSSLLIIVAKSIDFSEFHSVVEIQAFHYPIHYPDT